MNNALTKIQKVTERGQITLPKAWRDANKTNLIKLKIKEGVLEITPVAISDTEDDEIVWSAARDNDGQGIDTDEFIAILDKAIASK